MNSNKKLKILHKQLLFSPYGIFHNLDAGSTICTFISGNSSGTIIKKNFNDNIERTYCPLSNIGFIVGGNGSKSVICSHHNCIGEYCECEYISSRFLQSDKNVESFKNEFVNLFVTNNNDCIDDIFFIFIYRNEIITLKNNNENDYIWESYEEGSYYFYNDNLNSTSNNDNILLENNITKDISDWFCGGNPIDVACNITKNLFNLFQIKNQKSNTIGINLFQTGGEVYILPTELNNFNFKFEFNKEFNNLNQQLKKPKKIISAFNYFVRESHKNDLIPRENSHLTVNERNSIISAKWKSLSKIEKEPYVTKALLDKNRYINEVQKSNAIVDLSDSITTINTGSKKPRTAYNHFVHQEQQFIEEFDKELFSKIGRFAGMRWKNMTNEEKQLYEKLSSTEFESEL